MLTHPTEQRLIDLRLAGMAKALEEQRRLPDMAALSFEERLGFLVDREALSHNNKRLGNRLKFAGLRQSAVVEVVDMKASRGLDKALFAKLAAGDWIDQRQNLIVIGPTGVGKSWLACALAHKACRDDRAVLYQRVPRMFDALALARGDGRHARLQKVIARVELVILDDWGLASLTPDQGRDLLEIVDDRHGRGSTIVTSQLPVEHWHEAIAKPTIAETEAMARLVARLKLEHATPHTLWHTVGSHLDRLGFDLNEIGLALGHKARGTTTGYVHDLDDKRAAERRRPILRARETDLQRLVGG